MVSPQKTALAITIANREREILKDIDYENGYSLYVGIPFCPSICLYCSFSSYPLKQWKDRVYLYLDALCKEIHAVAQIMNEKGKKLDTVYMEEVHLLHWNRISLRSCWMRSLQILTVSILQNLRLRPDVRTALHAKNCR